MAGFKAEKAKTANGIICTLTSLEDMQVIARGSRLEDLVSTLDGEGEKENDNDTAYSASVHHHVCGGIFRNKPRICGKAPEG